MKIFLLVTAMFMTVCTFGQETDNVEGWRNAKWGMNEDTIKKLFSEITINKKVIDYSNSYSPISIKDYKIDGSKYDVAFLFDKGNKGLVQVNISIICGNYYRNYINSLEPILINKYGVPTFKNDYPYICKWLFKLTTIELRYVDITGRLLLTYEKTKPSENSKL